MTSSPAGLQSPRAQSKTRSHGSFGSTQTRTRRMAVLYRNLGLLVAEAHRRASWLGSASTASEKSDDHGAELALAHQRQDHSGGSAIAAGARALGAHRGRGHSAKAVM